MTRDYRAMTNEELAAELGQQAWDDRQAALADPDSYQICGGWLDDPNYPEEALVKAASQDRWAHAGCVAEVWLGRAERRLR